MADDKAERRRRAARALVRKMRTQWQEETAGSTLLAPISPSPDDLVKATLPRVPGLATTSLFLDLGCGDGRWLVEAAKAAHCRAMGWDLSSEMLDRGRLALAREPEDIRQLVSLERLDFVAHPPMQLRDATHVVIYWFADSCRDQADWLLSRLARDDCVIVSVAFRPPHWQAFDSVPCGGRTVWLYRAGDQRRKVHDAAGSRATA